MLFCPAKVRHLGASGRPAERRDEGHHKQFTQVVARIVGPGIGNVIEGSEKDVHAGNGLQKGVSRPRIHPSENRKTPQIRSDPKRDSPASDLGLRRLRRHTEINVAYATMSRKVHHIAAKGEKRTVSVLDRWT